MRLPFPLRLECRRGLLVYQLVLILLGIIILILVLLYIARRNQTAAPAPAAEHTSTSEAFGRPPFDVQRRAGTERLSSRYT
jgi:hypothetical protein